MKQAAQNIKLLFDFDGTLHKTDEIYAPAFHFGLDYLIQKGLLDEKDTPTDKEIGFFLGVQAGDVWKSIAPNVEEEERQKAAQIVREKMRESVEAGHAKLFDGLAETLDELQKEGYTLVFLSNCHHHYMETFRKALNLDKWFEHFYCADDYGWKTKSKVFSEDVAADLSLPELSLKQQFIMIGDRSYDMDVAKDSGLFSIGCAYGFGKPEEIEHASIIVNSPIELLGAVHELTEKMG